jgi:hypothetical protein
LLDYPPFQDGRFPRKKPRLTYRRVVKGEDLKRTAPRRRSFLRAKPAAIQAATPEPGATAIQKS